MRRFASLVVACLTCLAIAAQRNIDFASKFMQECDNDTAIQCVTIGPKMMEQLTKHHDAKSNENIAQAIQKLKTARIVMSTDSGAIYYEKAETLLKKFPKRFLHDKDYKNEHAHGTFYIRKQKAGQVVELIMLHYDSNKDNLIIVNLTGDIDEEFTNLLSKNLGNKK